MKDFLAYFTNDGSVGLYNTEIEDIYHSVNGAYSEAYEKFVMPADLKSRLENNREIKILDICFGIGYNSKAFLNFFVENFVKKNQKILKKNNKHKDSIGSIYTDKNKTLESVVCTEPKYTNNILAEEVTNYLKLDNEKNFLELKALKKNNIVEKGNNLCEKFSFIINQNKGYKFQIINIKNVFKKIKNNLFNIDFCKKRKENIISNKIFNDGYKIRIDAIDNNETLMKLSPFVISNKIFIRNQISFKLPTRLKKIFSNRILSKRKYKSYKEVDMILLFKLLEQYTDSFLDSNLTSILFNKKNSSYFDKKASNFIKLYQIKGYKYIKKMIKSRYLHNIYYQYISISYKNALKILKNNDISIRFLLNDARKAIPHLDCSYDVIFLDAFTPAKAPALWSLEFLHLLYNKLSDDGLILTYSTSASIRNAFFKNNFYVGSIIDENNNQIGTLASKNKNLIKNELSDYDLGLINSRSGIVYHDENLNNSNDEIIRRRNLEVKSSDLISATQFIKKYKEKHYEI